MVPWGLKWTLSGGRLDFQVDVRVSDAGQAAQRTPSVQRARACAELCISQNRQVAMLPWKRKRALSGGRLDLQGNQRFFVLPMSARRRSVRRAYARAHARARVGSSVLCRKKVATLPWELKWPFSGGRFDFQVNLCFFRCRPRGAACAARTRARTLVGSSALCRIEKVATMPQETKFAP